MGEAIISRGGIGIQDEYIPIVADRCSILVTVKDSNGISVEDMSVHCNDNGIWYNYHTNKKGQVLFMTNSGHANIYAYNYSKNSNFRYLDQSPSNINVDAPVGTSNRINLQFGYYPNFNFTKMTSNIEVLNGLFNGNCKLRCSDYCDVFIGGAGGGGSVTASEWGAYGSGGGGGASSRINNIIINKNDNYKFYIGIGGAPSKVNGNLEIVYNASSGGSTTAFGYVANGGGGANGMSGIGGKGGIGEFNGGDGGNGKIGGGTNGKDSDYQYWGGGGGGLGKNGGIPGGGKGGRIYDDDSYNLDGENGKNGGGGGAAGNAGRGFLGSAGSGSNGKISFNFYQK